MTQDDIIKTHDLDFDAWRRLNPDCIIVASCRHDERVQADVPRGKGIHVFDFAELCTEAGVEPVCRKIADVLRSDSRFDGVQLSIPDAILRLNQMNQVCTEISELSFDMFHMKYHIHGSHRNPETTVKIMKP
jgi:hypothetical protein